MASKTLLLSLLFALAVSATAEKQTSRHGRTFHVPLALASSDVQGIDCSPPRNVKVEAVSATALLVQWDDPSDTTTDSYSSTDVTKVTTTDVHSSTDFEMETVPPMDIFMMITDSSTANTDETSTAETTSTTPDMTTSPSKEEYLVKWWKNDSPENNFNGTTNESTYMINGLSPKTHYTVEVSIVSGDEPCAAETVSTSTDEEDEDNLALILGLSIGLGVPGLILIVALTFFGIKKWKKDRKKNRGKDIEFDDRPVDRERILREEFAECFLDMSLTRDSSIGQGYPDRNRYTNICPYNHSLVRLRSVEYINASYVLNRKFIATQDPMPNQVDDFWQLIWETNVRVIVRVSSDSPDQPCAIYIDAGSNRWVMGHDELDVTVEREHDFGTFYRRILHVSKGRDERRLHHYHMANWGHEDMPTSEDLLSLIMAARNSKKDLTSRGNSPVLVHCGAGVGRTGTVIAIWQQIDRECRQELKRVVQDMRQDRVAMVQNVEQYIHVDNCVAEYQTHRQKWDNRTFGDTYEDVY